MSTEAASVGQLMDSVLIKITRLEDSSDHIIDYRRRPRSPLKWNWEKATARLQSPELNAETLKRDIKNEAEISGTVLANLSISICSSLESHCLLHVCVCGACVLYVCVFFVSLERQKLESTTACGAFTNHIMIPFPHSEWAADITSLNVY